MKFLVLIWLGLFGQVVFAVTTQISDPQVLKAIEKSGFSFARQVVQVQLSGGDNHQLYQFSLYKSIVDDLNRDLAAELLRDPRTSVTMSRVHRLFDGRWLKSKFGRYELVGVINRTDRLSFAPEHCGELRLIYRLAYEKKQVYSRLPMTVNVVYWQRKSENDCRSWVRRWGRKKYPEQLLAEDGPLSKRLINASSLKSVEVNLQAIRWPSTIRPDMGGFAEYYLRVYQKQAGKFVRAKLENTPDVKKLKRTPSLRGALLSWLMTEQNARAVDTGVAKIPEKFLADKASSFALHGLSRLANRPFEQVYAEDEFRAMDFKKLTYAKSPGGYLRRLNDLSCVGCHQARTVAGFHFLGSDPRKTIAVNAIHVASSQHFLGDQRRRLLFSEALFKAPRTINHARALSERADDERGFFGAHCGLGDASFAKWTCAQGLKCVSHDAKRQALVGECFPSKPLAGSPCEVGRLSQRVDPKKDRIKEKKFLSCGTEAVCEIAQVGFPGGMCSKSCANLQAGESCGAIAILGGFNSCLAKQRPFAKCLSENVRPAALKGCSESQACRDDYICARSPINSEHGVCIPPYFLFQLRVDGHPSPI